MRQIGRTLLLVLTIAASALVAVEPDGDVFRLRGRRQILHHITTASRLGVKRPAVLFLPGDGGWRGAAIDMAHMISSLGYDVFGFDVRRYLSGFTAGHRTLTETQMATDLEEVVRRVARADGHRILLAGWSQGAGMAVLAAARLRDKELVEGVLTIALPETAALGWRWTDTLRSLFGRDPHEPEFSVGRLLPGLAPIPIWMVYGTRDGVTPVSVARRLARRVAGPRRQDAIPSGNHRLDAHRAELLRSFETGLDWLAKPRTGHSESQQIADGAGGDLW